MYKYYGAAHKELPMTTVIITNELPDEPMTADLSVIKIIQGNMGDKTKLFKFQLMLTSEGSPSEIICSQYDDNGEIVSNTVQLTDGIYEFELAHEGWISFTLPAGTDYKIVELDAETDGYTVESINAEGTIADTNIAAQFTNTKRGGIPTGFGAMTMVSVGIVLSTGIIILLIGIKRKTKKNDCE